MNATSAWTNTVAKALKSAHCRQHDRAGVGDARVTSGSLAYTPWGYDTKLSYIG